MVRELNNLSIFFEGTLVQGDLVVLLLWFSEADLKNRTT
jgi:hypothetical protein